MSAVIFADNSVEKIHEACQFCLGVSNIRHFDDDASNKIKVLRKMLIAYTP